MNDRPKLNHKHFIHHGCFLGFRRSGLSGLRRRFRRVRIRRRGIILNALGEVHLHNALPGGGVESEPLPFVGWDILFERFQANLWFNKGGLGAPMLGYLRAKSRTNLIDDDLLELQRSPNAVATIKVQGLIGVLVMPLGQANLSGDLLMQLRPPTQKRGF